MSRKRVNRVTAAVGVRAPPAIGDHREPWPNIMTALPSFHGRPIGRCEMSKSSMPAKCSLNVLANIVPHIDPVGEMGAVFMLIPVFGPNPDSLPSPFGQGAGVP